MTHYHCHYCCGTRDCRLEVKDGSNRTMHIPQPCTPGPRACIAITGVMPDEKEGNQT